MNLTLDFGNTTAKAGIFSGKKLIHIENDQKLSTRKIESLLKKFPVKKAISSSVNVSSAELERFLKKRIQFTRLLPTTFLPIKNYYQTPNTLGMDRLANMMGARLLFPGKNALVISAGTCITYDVISSKAEYFGGNITPGLDMRLKSMHTFTSRLPLVKKIFTADLFGRSTQSSILTGTVKGALLEMKGFIKAYKKKYPALRIILTGGDISFFDAHLEYKIFALPHLVLHGLNEILLLNDLQKA